MHGAKLETAKGSGKGAAKTVTGQYDNEFNYNGDPKSVEHLPMEVRVEMTRKLMGKFKQDFQTMNNAVTKAGVHVPVKGFGV